MLNGMSAFRPKADITGVTIDVRFRPLADIGATAIARLCSSSHRAWSGRPQRSMRSRADLPPSFGSAAPSKWIVSRDVEIS